MVKARTAGSFLGGIFNNPGIIILGGLAIALLFFQKDIREAFGNLGKINIELPEFKFPEFTFPEITFPTLPEINLCTLFGIGCNGDNGDKPPEPVGDLPFPPDVTDTGLLTDEQRAACKCGTNIIQDIQGDVSETCIICEVPEEGDPDFIGPVQPEEEFSLDTFFDEPEPIFDEPEPPFEPPIELPPGFEPGGPSFEGGTIFETTDESCTTLSCVIDRNPGFSASQAANRLAEILGTFGDFDFGTSTGSGFGPGDDPTGPLVTGGATLESEAKRAACVTCELFGLNCPICSGTI